MINLPLPEDNPFERLVTNANIGDLISAFGNRLNGEPFAASQAVRAMEASTQHVSRHHAENWAQVSDVVASAVGLELSSATVTPVTSRPQAVKKPILTDYIETPVKQRPVDRPVTSIVEARARVAELYGTDIDNGLVDSSNKKAA